MHRAAYRKRRNGRKEEGRRRGGGWEGAYTKGKGISLNRAVRAIIDLRWYVVNTIGDVRPWLLHPPAPLSHRSPPLPLSRARTYLPLSFPAKFLLYSSFVRATDVPFTDLFLIYNTYGPVVFLRFLSSYIPPRCPGFVTLTSYLTSSALLSNENSRSLSSSIFCLFFFSFFY